MGIIEEDPLNIPSGSERKRNSRDNEKAHDQEEEAKKKKQVSRSEIIMPLTDLPSNTLVEILARLPLRTLFIARSVCKTFGFLTTLNPHFIDLHSSHAAQILVFQFRPSDTCSSLLRMADHELDYKNSQLKPPLFQLPNVKGAYFLVNSCNGLLFLQQNGDAGDDGSLICNPVTSEYIIIPDVDPKMRLHSQTENMWLGFSPATNQYKVLRIFLRKNGNPDKLAAQVYAIGSDSWRDIDDTPLWCFPPSAQLVNGLIYWHTGRWPSLISFDFERENFGEVAFPPQFQNVMYLLNQEMGIGVLGGCLCMSCNRFCSHRIDLWVMRKCGDRESWTKDFVVDTTTVGPIGGLVLSQFKPLQFLRNGEILMLWNGNTLVCYDPRTQTLRYFSLHKDNLDFNVVALTPSFVPLKDALMVEKVLTQLRPRGDEEEL